jgi:hypothetical protein
MVHYMARGSLDGVYPPKCRAAVVTELCDSPHSLDPGTGKTCVSLAVLNPAGLFFHEHCTRDEAGKRGGTWHWPERA